MLCDDVGSEVGVFDVVCGFGVEVDGVGYEYSLFLLGGWLFS